MSEKEIIIKVMDLLRRGEISRSTTNKEVFEAVLQPEREYVCIVKVSGGKHLGISDEEYEFEIGTAEEVFIAAINFAQGYVESLMVQRKLSLMKPMVQQLDGYQWWQDYTGFSVRVVNKDGQVVCKWQDLV